MCKQFYGTLCACSALCCFVALVPLLGQGAFFYLTDVAPRKSKAEHWATKPWSQQNCTVLGKGIAYRGSCEDNWVSSAPKGSECPASDTAWTAQEMSAASACEAKGNSAWADARRLLVSGLGETINSDASTELDDVRGRRLGCGNSFLPWVQVDLGGSKRCAYRFGMAVSMDAGISTTTADDSEKFVSKFVEGAPTTCFIASADDCIVALEVPMNFLTDTWAWSVGGWPIDILLKVGLGCLVAGCLCCLAVCTVPKDLFDGEDDEFSDEGAPMWAE